MTALIVTMTLHIVAMLFVPYYAEGFFGGVSARIAREQKLEHKKDVDLTLHEAEMYFTHGYYKLSQITVKPSGYISNILESDLSKEEKYERIMEDQVNTLRGNILRDYYKWDKEMRRDFGDDYTNISKLLRR